MKKIGKIISEYPIIAFVLALAVLFAAVFSGNYLRASKVGDENIEQKEGRSVAVFDQSVPLYGVVLGEVDRADTITLTATKNGIVSRVLSEGQYVYRGGEVAFTADSYGGTSRSSVATAIAKRTLAYQEEVFDDQDTILDLQKDELNKTDRDAIKIARKQISLQREANEFSLDTAKLQVQQAQADAALERTIAPFAGSVQTTLVRVGDTVTTGQPLAVLTAQEAHDAQIVAYVGKARAARIDLTGRVFARIGDREIDLRVVHIAQAPTVAGSYAITLAQNTQGETNREAFREGEYVKVHLPIATTDRENTEDANVQSERIIPLDAVRYGTLQPEVYVIREGKAVPQVVMLGDVIGSYIVVTDGLSAQDTIITDRSVSADERVEGVVDSPAERDLQLGDETKIQQ